MGFYFSGRCRNRSGSWGMGPSELGVGSLLGTNDQLSVKIESGTKPIAGCRGQDPCVGRVGGLQIIETSANESNLRTRVGQIKCWVGSEQDLTLICQ